MIWKFKDHKRSYEGDAVLKNIVATLEHLPIGNLDK